MSKTTKMTTTELKKLIMEEVSRIQKFNSLKAKRALLESQKAQIEEELKSINECMGMEEEITEELAPATGMPAAAPATSSAPVDAAAIEKDLLSKIKLDPKAIQALSQAPEMVQEGFMDAIKGIFGKKDAAKKAAPAAAAEAGIATEADVKNDAKMQKFVGSVLEKAGISGMVGGAGAYLSAAIWTAIKGSAFAAVASGLPIATAILLIGGLIAVVAGSYMKYAAAQKTKAVR